MHLSSEKHSPTVLFLRNMNIAAKHKRGQKTPNMGRM